MKIGIIGAGNIGSALARHFCKLQHGVQIVNSRGPETLSKLAEETGATPVTISEVARGADLLVIAIPMKNVPSLPRNQPSCTTCIRHHRSSIPETTLLFNFREMDEPRFRLKVRLRRQDFTLRK